MVRAKAAQLGVPTMAMRLYLRARMRAALCIQVSKDRVNHSSTHFTCVTALTGVTVVSLLSYWAEQLIRRHSSWAPGTTCNT